MRRLLCTFALLAGIAGGALDALGQTKNEASGRDNAAEREAEALAFARLHHPELRDLLERLKKHRPGEFAKAVRQLYQSSERLDRIRERDPERYRVDLELWKIDSRVRLLAAQLAMTKDPALIDEIKGLLRERVELRLEQLQLERERLANRLQKVNGTIAELELDRETAVQKEFDRLTASLSASGPKAKTGRPGAQKPAASKRSEQEANPKRSNPSKANER